MALSITDIWCQVSGKQWQKECTALLVFEENLEVGEKYTPEVPSEITDWDEFITPDPVAPAAWSPAPPTIITLFYGSIQGGLKCDNGVCVYVPGIDDSSVLSFVTNF